MSRPLSLSLTLPSFGPIFPEGEWHRVLELARLAEQAGVDRILLTDHVVMGKRLDRYAWGPFPFGPEVPWLDPLATLAAIAGVTQRIRMSTKILIAPLRPAPVLAKMLATIDVISRGRLEIGVSTGWQREEYDAAGVDWTKRGQLLTDTIGACKALWGASPARFRSPSFSFDDIWCEPKPLQPGGIPVWFGGSLHARNLARIVELGDGWIPAPYETLAAVAAGVPRLRDAWTRAGRDPNALQIQGDLEARVGARGKPDLRASLEAASDWAEAGATTLNVVMTLFVGRIERAGAFFEQLARHWEELA